MFEAEKTVVFRPDVTSFVFNGVAAIENPLLAKRRKPLLHIAHLARICPGPTGVVHTKAAPILRRDLAQGHAHRRMKLALDVNAFACRKRGVEVGGILELEFRSAHFRLPSSALSESGSRGRSLLD